MATDNNFIPRPITFELLFLELREPLKALWFECFEALKVDRDELVKIRQKYAKDPKIGVIEAIRLWVDHYQPSWEELVHALRYVIMETELADRIERLYVDPSRVTPNNCKAIELEDIQDAFGQEGPLCEAFTLLLTDVLDQFNDGSSCYTLYFAMGTLACPDGTPFICKELIQSRSTPDSILMPLILHNYITELDIDFLIHLLKLTDRYNALLPSINNYYNNCTGLTSQPVMKYLRNVRTSSRICCYVKSTIKKMEFKDVWSLKETLKKCFQLEAYPYIIQFLGWSEDPYKLCFQIPLPCILRVQLMLKPYPHDLINANITRVILEVGSAIFTYQE
jgi:hypothetical protein